MASAVRISTAVADATNREGAFGIDSADVPHAASREDQVTWLYDWWERIDAWITAVNPAPMPAPDDNM